MRPDEPVVLLEFAGLVNEHVLRDAVEAISLVDGRAVGLDDPAIDEIEGGEVRLAVRAAEIVVIPGAVGDDETRQTVRNAAEGCDSFGGGVDHRLNARVL